MSSDSDSSDSDFLTNEQLAKMIQLRTRYENQTNCIGLTGLQIDYNWAIHIPEYYNLYYGNGNVEKGERRRKRFVLWFETYMVRKTFE